MTCRHKLSPVKSYKVGGVTYPRPYGAIAVQVNGKLRGTIEMLPSTSKDEAEAMALALESVQRATEGAPPRKVIVVPNKVINVVI